MIMVPLGRIELLTFRLKLLGSYEYHYLVVLLLCMFILFK